MCSRNTLRKLKGRVAALFKRLGRDNEYDLGGCVALALPTILYVSGIQNQKEVKWHLKHA